MGHESNESRIECLTNHLTLFAGKFFVVPNKIDFHDVFGKFTQLPPENLFVLCTVSLLSAIYAVGLIFARKADKRDKMKVGFSNCVHISFLMYSFGFIFKVGVTHLCYSMVREREK